MYPNVNPYGKQFQPYQPQIPNMYQNQFPGMNQPQFITKQVSNIEEAKACLVDPLSTYLFIDMNSGKIYLKRMNNNGLSDFYTFAVEVPVESKNDPFDVINKRLQNIENILGGKSNVQSVSNNANDAVYAESKPINDSTNEITESSTVQQSSGDDKWKVRFGNQNNGGKHR